MKIRGDRLKQIMREKGVGLDQLAGAIARKGLDRDDAARAIANWYRGSDHPRCKAEDINAMARELGCGVGELARFISELRHHRGSPRKAALLTELIRGKPVDEALNLLTFTTKRAAVNVKKALNAAIADAEQADADVTALYVAESRVDQAQTMKRFQPKDRGRSHPIMKRTSHITVGVQERD